MYPDDLACTIETFLCLGTAMDHGGGALVQQDGVSYILQEDGSSHILLE